MLRFLLVSSMVIIMSSSAAAQNPPRGTLHKEPFGKTTDGVEVEQYTLTNKNNMSVKIITYGGIIRSINVPDRNGKMADVCLGFDTLEGYLQGHPFFGCITGRVANRIAKGKFTLNGKEYNLHVNNGPNSLHGGKVGFDKKVWKVLAEVDGTNYVGIKLHYTSPDGEEGYPGTLDTMVTYTLNDNNELQIDYAATTDASTPVNLTNHAYFNLTGGKSDVLGQRLKLNSYKYTAADDTLIPTGEIKEVSGPLDFFSKEHTLGDRIKELYDTPFKGYDHNFLVMSYGDMLQLGKEALAKRAKELGIEHPDVVKAAKSLAEQETLLKRTPEGLNNKLKFTARVTDPESGRVMEMKTTEPGVQLYTGNFLDTKNGKAGVTYGKHWGVCLEAQHFPNSINTPSFPSTVLKPGETYRQTTVYGFGVEK
jgi:aldose 1-epimerase